MLENVQNEKQRHILFLENLLNKLKNNQLTNEEQKDISEFYIKFLYLHNNEEIDERKFIKYMSLGWYIYEFLNNDNNN